MRLTDANKNIIAAAILAFGLIVSAIIYAYSNRYELSHNYPLTLTDKWNGTATKVKILD